MQMKDGLGAAAVGRLAEAFAGILPGFPRERFAAEALDGIERLELKQRVHHLIGVLHRFLPADFPEAADLLVRLRGNTGLRGFTAWPIIDYVGEHGLGHPEKALAALKALTPLFSAEFALRPFLLEHQSLTLQTLETWCGDPDEHVRRLVSEGTRPRLPWGKRLPPFIDNPSPVIRLLEKLKDDPSAYVRRSVANNLNDIAKDHPDRVVALCKNWICGAGPDRQRLVRHALRTLVKSGHPDVFGLLGHTTNPKLELLSMGVTPEKILLGEAIEFRFALQSTSSKPQTVVIDYAIHHVKANGTTRPKVFKFRTLALAPGETVELAKRHAIKPITTRSYHPGRHAVELLVNGEPLGQAKFDLLCP